MNQAEQIRAAVEQAAPARRCPECGDILRLRRGRVTAKWFWVHTPHANCVWFPVKRAVFFDTQEEAKKAERVFA